MELGQQGLIALGELGDLGLIVVAAKVATPAAGSASGRRGSRRRWCCGPRTPLSKYSVINSETVPETPDFKISIFIMNCWVPKHLPLKELALIATLLSEKYEE